MEIVAIFGVSCAVIAVLAWLVGEWQGYRRGVKAGHQAYADQLRFERRWEAMIEPDRDAQRVTRGPSAAFDRQRRARVSDAHMSQPRADWSAE